MNEPLISVIVPIYKAEKYLSRCVDSIINQTYKNLEIILVDDGSPDNCPKICDEYASIDNRIKVYHIENGGSGKARNIGFKYSTGDFISYIDSDDIFSKNFILELYKNFETDIDIVECEYVTFCHIDEISFSSECLGIKGTVYNNENAMKEHILDKKFRQVIWNKLYRRNVICNINFPENKGIDDEYWTYQVIANSRKLVHMESKLYAYRQQSDSIMHTLSIKNRLQTIEAKCIRHKFICKNFSNLELISGCSINNIYMYQLQFVSREFNKNEYCEFRLLSKNLISSYEINKKKYYYSDDFNGNLWRKLFRIFPNFTVNIRNLLKIGL